MTIFEKIIAKEIPAHIVYEDDICIAILDKFPIVHGQTLVIPKKCTAYIFDLDTETYQHLFAVTKKLGPVLDSVFGAIRTCIVVEGFEVPHVHIKLYPTTETKLVTHGGNEASDETLAAYAERIKAELTL